MDSAASPGSPVSRIVGAFYDEMPFDFEPEPQKAAHSVLRRNFLQSLFERLSVDEPFGKRVLDVGCGVGRSSATLARYYRCEVTGIDLSATAIAAAERLAATLGLAICFEARDLLRYRPSRPFEMILASGVFHHTESWRESLLHCLRHCVAPAGVALVSLYHRSGRHAFREHFATLKARGASEEEQFTAFRDMVDRSWHRSSGGLHPFSSEVNARSWFRDQVLHPHEAGATLGEVRAFADEAGVTLLSADLPGFHAGMTTEEVDRIDAAMFERGRDHVSRDEYWHGLFNFAIARSRS